MENNTEMTSDTQKFGFIGSTPYKIGENFDKKLILWT